MRRTLAWMAILLAALGWTAWSQVQTLWQQRDALIAQRIRARLEQIAPQWRVEFATAELLEGGRVRLTELQVGPRERGDVLAQLPEIILQLDPDLLASSLQVLITRAEVRDVELIVERDGAGRWNWEDLPPVQASTAPAPEIVCTNGRVAIRLQAGEYLPEFQFNLTGIHLELTNRSHRAYALRGSSRVDEAGALEFSGTVDLDSRAWTLSGRCADLQSPDRLLQLAANLSPDARQRLESIARQCAIRDSGPPNGAPVRSVGHSADTPERPRCCLPALGVAAQMELAFNLMSPTATRPLQYQVGAKFRDGVINNPALPLPLRDLHGEVFVDNAQVIVRSLQASNGDSRLFLDGHLRRDGVQPARRFVVQAQNLQFGREIQSQLIGPMARFYDAMRPAGRFHIDMAAETDAQGDWKYTLNQFEALDCSVQLAAFPYPTRGITGRIWQEQDRFHVDFRGFAGDRPFTATGEFRNPGPQLTTDIAVEVDNVPIDDTLRGAFSTEQLATARAALEKLRLVGLADVDARVFKRGIPGEPVRVAIDAQVHDAAFLYEQFPWGVTNVSARVQNDPLADDPALRHIWRITDVRGQHGPAQVVASGGFGIKGPHALLDLTVTALDTPIDQDLEVACVTASPALRELFESIGRVGAVDLENIRLLWSPGAPPVVSLPSILVRDGLVQLKYWPYPWERVTGKLAWDQQRLVISNLTGWYGEETYLQIDNHGEPQAAVLEIPRQGELAWQLHLEDVRVRQLIPDSVFRRSLIPSGVAAIVETLDPRGPLDLDIGLDVKQFAGPEGLVTAAWHLDAALKNNTLAPGVELSNVNGAVRITHGEWDGRRSFVDGYFDLESATALDLQLSQISGPFLVDGDDVYVGTPAWPGVRGAPANDAIANPYARREVQADVYQGKLGCSLQARLDPRDPEKSTYRAAVSVRDARLETWAGENGYTSERLRGPVNGQMDFVGVGTSDRTIRGSGWVQISPAQLYELPVLNRVLASFDLRQPNRTAFTYAYGEFQLENGYFNFSLIDLVGEALRLVGRGSVAYADGLDNQLAIEFYRSKFRNQIPIWGQIFSAVTTNSIGIQVGGTISNPIVNVQPKLGIVDDTLRKLLDAFDAGQTPLAPRPAMPGGPPRMSNGPR